MEEKEEWRNVAGHEKYKGKTQYEVSSLGRIRNKKTGRILKLSKCGGYLSVNFSFGKKQISSRVHRVVALAFIENPENKPEVNHKNKNGRDNRVANLEWNTKPENAIHRSAGVIQTTNQNIKLWRVDKDTLEKLQAFDSIYDAAVWCKQYSFANSIHNARGYISYALKNNVIRCGFGWIKQEQPDLEGEIWKNVSINGKTFNDYFVSNLGRFKNSKGIIMENYKPHHSGYIFARVNIQKYSMHQIVASTFLENPENKPAVNHIDGCKTNNSVSNLEWCTIPENNQHNHKAGLIKLFKRRVGQYDLNWNLIKEFKSIKEAMDETNIKSIKGVLYKKQNTAGGFNWEYLDE
jgi:hypothetical protein